MVPNAVQSIATCLALTKAISTSRTLDEIYEAALDALSCGLGVARASILLFDEDGVMRFKASRGLSAEYRRAVEGHTPWRPDSPNANPIWVEHVGADASLASYAPVFAAEGIAAMAFIPLVSVDRVIGKFMLYYGVPTPPGDDILQLAGLVAAQVAFAVERTRTAEQARRSEERLRFALDSASMGTWDWDLVTNEVRWSDNLPAIHGLPPGSFDGTFASYEREIHPEDRGRVYASIQRALREGVPHDVEYRIVAPDGTVRWCEGKGRVEYEDGRPARMSGVCMMVTRRKEAELARIRTAEESSRLKDEFLATLSHELRTPLNAIVGWVQLLQSGAVTEERTRQAIDVIARNARLQTQLIEDILDVSRIITGKLQIDREPVSLPDILNSVLAGIAPIAAAQGLAVEPRIEPEIPPLEGDPKRLHQVLNNILSNAIKFTPAGGTITVSCTHEGGCVSASIEDSGAGIAADFLPFVFDRFRQADSRATRAHGGLGLGLAIARHLVEQHDGTIHADSAGTGKGTRITVRLPVRSAVAAATAMPVGGPPVAARLEGLTVLVVDDQQDSREMLAALLERRGAHIVQSASAEAGLVELADGVFDLVIADIAMPGVDGYQFVRRLRLGGHLQPAIAVTAFAWPDDRRRALDSGYDGYLSKPIDDGLLMTTVLDLIGASRHATPG